MVEKIFKQKTRCFSEKKVKACCMTRIDSISSP